MNQAYFTILIFSLLFASCTEKQSESTKTAASVSTKKKSEFDKIKLNDLNGNSLDLHQYKGKTIFINFWATWCKPCIQELPSIEKAMEKVKDKEVIFLFASNEAVEEIEQFQKNHAYKFHYVQLENLEELNIMTLPATYIFNPEGNLVFSEMGYRKWDTKNNIDLILNAGK
jgi:thiol-disulfide isomerase/thioredoxin